MTRRDYRVLDHITGTMAAAPDRKHDAYRVLRQAMGYCWSVACAASPEAGRPLIEKWLRSSDPDIAWVMKSNLGMARMSALGNEWLAQFKDGGQFPLPLGERVRERVRESFRPRDSAA